MKTALLAVAGLALAASFTFGQSKFATKPAPVRSDLLTFNADAEGPAEQAKAAAEQAAIARNQALENAQVIAAPAAEAPVAAPKARPSNPNGGGNVQVNATAGATGPTFYATVKLAFDAINAGTHQGAITVAILASTVEGATPATLNSGDATPASYTSVLIQPSNDGVTISGNPVTGFGVIQLNGADNVTINGDNPNSAGTNRNLTVSNTAAATVIANSAIRIAVSAAVTSANNNTIKNCILLGNVTGGNLSTITGTTTSSNSSFGIYAGGNGGATPTGAPTAITSVTTNTAPAGTTINNLVVDNNFVSQCARAVVFNGAALAQSTGVTVSNNTIGDQGAATPATPPFTSPSTTVYAKAIWFNGTSAVTVTGNTINNVISYVATPLTAVELVGAIGPSVTITGNTINNIVENGATGATKGVLISSANGAYTIASNLISSIQTLASSSGTAGIDAGGTSTAGLIELNKVSFIRNVGTGTFGCWGINVAAGTGVVVRNNFISDLSQNMTGGGAFSTTFGVHGLRIAGGTLHKVYHNSVNMFGALTGTPAASLLTSALTIVGTGQTGLDVRNNILANTLSGGTTSIAHVSIYLPSAGTSAMNLTDNNNDYFHGADATTQGAGQAGSTAGTNFFVNLAALKTYSMTLSAAGTNDNASLEVDPQYLSTTNLHIAVASPMVDMGANVGVNTDIDGQMRIPPPDIGADEPSGITPPMNDIAATAINNPAPGSTISFASIMPKASFQNVGTATQSNVMVQFTITGPAGYSYSDTQTIASIAANQTVMVTFAATSAFTNAGSYSMTASVITPDANPANDSVSGMFTVVAPLVGGSYNVPGDYPSLTNAGGIFQAINAAGATGNLTINITADLTSETGANALNQIAGAFNVLIKPTGVAHIISGTGAALALIKLNGADNVTIDGSLTGGTDRSLTLTFGNASGVVVWIASASVSDGANNNTVKNCIISGNAGVTVISGILTGSGTTLGGDAETGNSNNTIMNNAIFRVQNACYLRGAPLPNFDQNWLVTGNNFGSAVAADKPTFRGMLIGNAVNFVVRLNTISGLASTAASTSTVTGIQVAIATSGGVIERNMITDVKQTSTGTYAAYGIDVNNGTNVVVRNNFVSDINHDMSGGLAFSPSFGVFGIIVDAGTGHQIYANSVNLFGVQAGTPASSLLTAAFAVSSTTATGVDVRDNIFANNITGGTTAIAHVAVYLPSGGTSAMNFTENNNSYYNGTDTGRQGVGQAGVTAGTNFFVTLPMLQAYSATLSPAGTNDNASLASTGAVPYASNTDLHITNAAPEANLGVPLSGVIIDIDGQPRDPSTPDIGADEVTPAAPLTATSALSRKVHGGSGTFDIDLPLTGPTVGIECRAGGGTSDYEVVVTFSNNVVSGTATVTPGAGGTATVNGAPTFSANTMTIELTGVSDVQQLTVNAVNVTDQFAQVLPNTAVPMKVLIGDVNNSSGVASSDIAQVKSQSGQPVTGANFRADVVPNGGSIGSSDVAITKSKSGNTLP